MSECLPYDCVSTEDGIDIFFQYEGANYHAEVDPTALNAALERKKIKKNGWHVLSLRKYPDDNPIKCAGGVKEALGKIYSDNFRTVITNFPIIKRVSHGTSSPLMNIEHPEQNLAL